MDWEKVNKRLNEIVQVDVMTSSKADFLATHMPFDRLSVQFSGHRSAEIGQMSEEEVYRKFVRNPQNEHRFIIVKGRNGVGKSHLIRWMHARMESDPELRDTKAEKIVFIRRIDNSLRGAMRQLLEQGIVSDPEQRERMQKFVDNADAQSEAMIKSTLFYAFISEVENGSDNDQYTPAERKRLASFLLSDPVRQFLLRDDGPITRFYELIAQPHSGVNMTEPSFTLDDFLAMKILMTDVSRENNPQNKRMLSEIMHEQGALKISRFLNGYAHAVIQRCANIVQGDAENMIRQLRMRLKKDAMNLTVFIEDMTTFTGIDSELVKVLSIKHGGEYSDLCRVTAVIGLTDAYYGSRFLGNFQDRVTHQISVDDQTFGSRETLSSMAARYLNAAYLDNVEVDEWLNSGAAFGSLPYRTLEPKYPWEVVELCERRFSLFPFTSHALEELYGRLAEKTPRFFIRDIIQLQMHAFIGLRTQGQVFPNASVTALGNDPAQFMNIQHTAAFENATKEMPDQQRRALRTLMCIWGNATIFRTVNVEEERLAGLPMEFYHDLNQKILPSIVSVGSTPDAIVKNPRKDAPASPQVPQAPEVSAEVQRVSPIYQRDIQDIDSWYHQKTQLRCSEDVRTLVYNFLLEAINWQMLGVPAFWLATNLSVRAVYIENQAQRAPSREEATIVIDRSEETYFVLLGLTHYRYNGKRWVFKDAAFFQMKCAIWLEKHKEEFARKAAGTSDANMQTILAASMALEFIRIGMMGGFTLQDTPGSIKSKLFQNNVASKRPQREGDWDRLLSNFCQQTHQKEFQDNQTVITRMVNNIMGRPRMDASSNKYLVNRTLIDDAYTQATKAGWDMTSLLPEQSVIEKGRHMMALARLQEYTPKVRQVVDSEAQRLIDLIQNIETELGDSRDPEIWRKVSDSMKSFLDDCSQVYSRNYPAELKENATWIRSNAVRLASVVRNGRQEIESGTFASRLIFFSGDPCGVLATALKAVYDVAGLAQKEGARAEHELAAIRTTLLGNQDIHAIILATSEIIDLLNQLGGELPC